MKNIVKYCLLLLFVTYYSCDDPYKDTMYMAYDVQPAGSYLQTRPEIFSEWIKVLRYADLLNAINQADDAFTVLAPTNSAVEAFYARKGVSSIEELGETYARSLAQYHILSDSIQRDDFVKGGALEAKTLSGDVLEVTFDEDSGEGGFNSVYINREAHVKEFAVSTANGVVYVLDDVLSPATETILERLSGYENYRILGEALEMTGWDETLNTTSTSSEDLAGNKTEQRCYFTLLAVSDEVFQKDGISTVTDLASKLGAGTDYTSKENALNRYVAYHILEGSHKLTALQTFNQEGLTRRLWATMAENGLIMVSQENGGYYLNYDGGDTKAQFMDDEDSADEQVKNGYIQRIDGYLPICTTLQPISYYFDLCDFPEVASYIGSYGKDGQLYQQKVGDVEGATPLANYNGSYVSCYDMTMGPSGTSTTSWGNLEYRTTHDKYEYAWWKMLNYDQLIINIGYNGTLTMNTPTILAGKYKVTLYFTYATSMNFMRLAGDIDSQGSNGGLTSFTFDSNPNQSASRAIYASVPNNTLECYNTVLFDELEFTSTQTHNLQLVVLDPAASTHSSFRLQLDYLLFEPIN